MENLNNTSIFIGIDGGQGFLKMKCTISSIPEGELCIGNKEKRLRYNDGYEGSDKFKYSSVKKTFIFAIFPDLPESHFNMNSLLKEMKWISD